MGYIGRIKEADVRRIESAGLAANYKGTDHIGKLGIEGAYERELHGTTGSEQVEIDAGGRAIRALARSEPQSGNNLQVTLDIRLQKVAEEAFQDYRGAMVALDPKTGDVLALVSRPGFDPNLFVDGIDPQNWDALKNSPDKPLNNRALRGQYPPGLGRLLAQFTPNEAHALHHRRDARRPRPDKTVEDDRALWPCPGPTRPAARPGARGIA